MHSRNFRKLRKMLHVNFFIFSIYKYVKLFKLVKRVKGYDKYFSVVGMINGKHFQFAKLLMLGRMDELDCWTTLSVFI